MVTDYQKYLPCQIDIENIDGKIWNKDQILANLLQVFKSNQKHFYIGTNGEGLDLSTSGFEDLVKLAATISDRDFNSISIVNGNLLKSNTTIHELTVDNLLELDKYKTIQISDRTKDIKFNFGSFVGRSNWIRLALSSYLYTMYKDKSLMSFHWSNHHDYHRANLGLEELIEMTDDYDLASRAIFLLSNCPIKLTEPLSYPILFDVDPLDFKFYDNIFLDIVSETYFTGNVFFCTEKTWRPIEAMTPFVSFGPQYFLKNLRQLGFETFSNWWSEDYDKYCYYAKLPEILKIIDDVGSWSIDECNQVYEEMKPILLHNKNVLQTLTWDKIRDTKFYNTESNK